MTGKENERIELSLDELENATGGTECSVIVEKQVKDPVQDLPGTNKPLRYPPRSDES